jgi:uncharacterized phage-associated protein
MTGSAAASPSVCDRGSGAEGCASETRRWFRCPSGRIVEHMFDSVTVARCSAGATDVSYPRPVPLSVHTVAAEFRSRQPAMGVVKMHKLLYLGQGHHLAAFDRPLFAETISAWDNGPVVGELWYREDRRLEAPPLTVLGEAELNTIGYVMSRYGALTGRDLVHLTHSEDPWRRADVDRKPGTSRPIPSAWIREYFLADFGDDDIVLDSAQVRAWLSDAAQQRDTAGPRDEPGRIAARIRELSGRSA